MAVLDAAQRCETSVAFLGRNVEERRRLALHVTRITSLFVAHIERMRRFFGKRRLLKFIGDHERAQEFVVVQLARHLRFVTSAAEFRRFQKRPHHCSPVRRNVVEDLLISDAREHSRSVLFHQQRGLSHYVAADATAIDRLNRVASDAGHTVIIEWAFDV